MGFCSDEEYQEFLRSCLNLNACCNVLGSSYSNTGFQYPMKSKSGALSSGLIRHSNAGNSVQWISSLVSAGQPIRELKMRCLLTPIPNTARGGWCLRMTKSALASTASATYSVVLSIKRLSIRRSLCRKSINKVTYAHPSKTKPLFHSATNPLPTNSVNLLLNGKLTDSAAYKLGFFSTSSIS